MLERLKVLHKELVSRAHALDGQPTSAVFADRASLVDGWIESLENDWPINTHSVRQAVSEFERQCGIGEREPETMVRTPPSQEPTAGETGPDAASLLRDLGKLFDEHIDRHTATLGAAEDRQPDATQQKTRRTGR